jgi:transketolase N-terminal domain/subunit
MSESKTTFQQMGLLHHTLGLSARQREPFRNHFVASDGHSDLPNLLVLVEKGLMKEYAAPDFLGGGSRLFKATQFGIDTALAALPPKGAR